ncbi:MAG TPA: HAMP domain-containing sensor histidine kinase [Candidatus Moranbacteria bacterium]|nr:HAMP domain-containing sensor histidine kinase [Candidatus Moranbacteria bacterium]
MEFCKNKLKIKIEFINDLDLRKQAQELGIKIWQTPSFLFIVFGLATTIIMAATYFISKNYENPAVLVVSECLVVVVIFIVEMLVARFIEQMARLNRMKSEFVSIASHQLRTPLSAVKWEAELLLKKLKKGLSKKQINNIESIYLINQRMIHLVNDLLDVARIDQNRLILRKQEFDFSKMVEEIVREVVPTIKLRHIEIRINAKKDLPMAVGDPEKVRLVVENLLDNAVKYTTSGGKIGIKIFKTGKYLSFEIKDNGVGIPEEQLNRVFEKFFRSDNAAKYQTEGTGLGLYIAKNIIEQLGGEIWFRSIENVGSVFSFSLPSGK